MKHKVVCIQPIHPEGMEILHAREDLEVIVPESPEPQYWEQHLADAEAIVVRVTRIERWMIEKARRLKVSSRHGVGVDNIVGAAATGRGVVVATIGLANAPSVVEHTLAMMFALAKRLREFDRAVRTGDYMIKMKLDAIDVAGRSVLIVGLGRIGSRLAVACNALGMHCIGIDPAFSADEIRAMGCEPASSLHNALPRADFVSLHCPLQADRRNLRGAREGALMKPPGFLINSARGGFGDEAALLDALESGRLKGAGLDVQVVEPPTADDPLLKSDKIILTPHAAATTAEGVVRVSKIVAQNVLDHFDGRLPAAHIFNPEALSRAKS